MGLADVADLFRRAKLNKGLQDPVDITGVTISAGEKLAIRIRTGTAFTKLDVRLRVELPFLDKTLHIKGAFFYLFAPFEDQRFQAIFNKLKGGKHAGRTKTDDDRPLPAAHSLSRFRLRLLVNGEALPVFITVINSDHQ